MESNKYKKVLTGIAIFLLGVFIFLGVKYAFLNKKVNNNSTVSVVENTGNYSWNIVQEGSMTYVYLDGEDLEKVSAVELKLNIDPQDVKFVSAKPSGFFSNPLMIKWSEQTGEFSLIENPETSTVPDKTKAVLLVETEILQPSKLSVDPTSLIYVRDTGGFSPRSHEIQLVK